MTKQQLSTRDILISVAKAAKAKDRADSHIRQDYFTEMQRKRVFAQFEHRCFNCGSKHYLTLDHHKPRNRGHKLRYGNVVALCRECNAKKDNMAPEKFYARESLEKLRELLHEQLEWED